MFNKDHKKNTMNNKCLLTCEQSTHHTDSQACHSEGFRQSILCAKVRKKLDRKDLRVKSTHNYLQETNQALFRPKVVSVSVVRVALPVTPLKFVDTL